MSVCFGMFMNIHLSIHIFYLFHITLIKLIFSTTNYLVFIATGYLTYRHLLFYAMLRYDDDNNADDYDGVGISNI